MAEKNPNEKHITMGMRAGETPPEGFQTVVRTGIKRVAKRTRGTSGVKVQPTPSKSRSVVPAKGTERVYASASKYTIYDEKQGTLKDDVEFRNKMRAYKQSKIAGMFGGDVGWADIAESGNIGFYSYEYPVDALELPQSRAEELRFYRLASDRDPIVGRAIDLHTELPLSKFTLEKPKCSSPKFADYVFDYFNRVVNETAMFEDIMAATREYFIIGEAFLFVEDSDVEIEYCKEAEKLIQRLGGDSGTGEGGADADPGNEAENKNENQYESMLDYLNPKHSSWVKKAAEFLKEAQAAQLTFDPDVRTVEMVVADILEKRASVIVKQRAMQKIAKIIGRNEIETDKIAAPGDAGPPVGGAFPAGDETNNPAPDAANPDAPDADPAGDDAAGDDAPAGGGAPPFGGGGGGGGDMGGGDL